MKTILCLGLCLAIQPGLAQNYLRVIGTNLHDCSAVAATTNRNIPHRLVGLVDRVYTHSVKLMIDLNREIRIPVRARDGVN